MKVKVQTRDKTSKKESFLSVNLELQEEAELLLQTKKHQYVPKIKNLLQIMTNSTSIRENHNQRIRALQMILRTLKTVLKNKTRTLQTRIFRTKREIRNSLKMTLRKKIIKRNKMLRIIEVTSSRRCFIKIIILSLESNQVTPAASKRAPTMALCQLVCRRFLTIKKNNWIRQ